MDYIDYRKMLGIGFDDDEKLKLFYNVFFNTVESMSAGESSCKVSLSEYTTYCNNAGVRGDFAAFYSPSIGWSYIVYSLKEVATKNSFAIFLVRLVAFINCTKESIAASFKPSEMKTIVEKCFIKAHISVEFKEDSDGYFVFPQGAKELDDALVSQPLTWLKSYPLTYAKYVQTLRKYSDNSDSNSNIADDFRKVLESFFQEFFNSTKSLENLKSEYGCYLKSKGVPTEITGNLQTLLSAYTNYNNTYAKHHDGADENILEFLMYQTGIIIRLMITLNNG